MKIVYLIQILLIWSNEQYATIGSEDGLVLHRRQAFVWADDGLLAHNRYPTPMAWNLYKNVDNLDLTGKI